MTPPGQDLSFTKKSAALCGSDDALYVHAPPLEEKNGPWLIRRRRRRRRRPLHHRLDSHLVVLSTAGSRRRCHRPLGRRRLRRHLQDPHVGLGAALWAWATYRSLRRRLGSFLLLGAAPRARSRRRSPHLASQSKLGAAPQARALRRFHHRSPDHCRDAAQWFPVPTPRAQTRGGYRRHRA